MILYSPSALPVLLNLMLNEKKKNKAESAMRGKFDIHRPKKYGAEFRPAEHSRQ